jgi:Bacterial PH domain
MLYDKLELEADEQILKTVRKHWFVITLQMLGIVLMGLMPVIACIAFLSLPFSVTLTTLFTQQISIIMYMLSLWLLLTVMAGAATWTSYFLDLWIITDRRIIVIDQFGFFNRKVSNFRLERMQDIKVSVVGIIPTLLNFGTLKAETAGSRESNFVSPALPDPRGLQALIQTAMDARLGSFKEEVSGLE